jgi:hypothetical protein
VSPRRRGQVSEAPGAAFPRDETSGGDAADPIPPNLPTVYLPDAPQRARAAKARSGSARRTAARRTPRSAGS